MKTRILNSEPYGNYTDEWLVGNANKVINGALVSEWELVELCVNDFIKPTYNGSEWIESATDEEVDAIKVPKYTQLIKDIYTSLMIRALSSSMNKTSDNVEYLNAQREEYQNKYDLAKGIKVDSYLNDSLIKEMNRDFLEPDLDIILQSYGLTPTGTHLDKMYQLVIFRFEYSLDKYNQFKAFLVDMRTKSITMLENREYSRLDNVFSLANNIPPSLTVEDAQTLYNTFDAI